MSASSDTDGDRWFADIAQEFYPKPQKPGAALRSLTGYEERNCQRYASAAVQPAGHFIRQLLRSDHGAQWLDALMAGCTAPWWLEHQRDVRLAAASKRFIAEVTKQD